MNTAASHRLMLFSAAPFIGIICWFVFSYIQIELSSVGLTNQKLTSFTQEIEPIRSELTEAKSNAQTINDLMGSYIDSYNQSAHIANETAYRASLFVDKPLKIYDERITAMLGDQLYQVNSSAIDLKIFPLRESSYSGYAMKVHLKESEAMKMVLGKDKFGGSETTLQAAERYNAIAGVNAGGFADDSRNGLRYPLSTTMVDGEYVNGFAPSFKDLFFVGLSSDGKLIGGEFARKEDLDQLSPVFGASFVPILIQNGEKQVIPRKWQTSPVRAARTVIANYKNDHLLFIVVNGADESGSSGASLKELQDKLYSLGVVDAYNLDGGGSTSLVYKGTVLNNPSDDKLRRLPTHFLFFD